MTTSSETQQIRLVTRREAIRRVSALLGGVAFVGGSGLLAALEKASDDAVIGLPGTFTAEDIAFLDEIAETILPETKTPGAKAAKTGAFMALMVTDSYSPAEQKVFRDGMHKLDAATKKANNVSFMHATPAQRLAVLSALDHEQMHEMDAREAAQRKSKGLATLPADETIAKPKTDPNVPDAQNENVPVAAVNETEERHRNPVHYFRMMKELTLLGYFTSELGCTKAMRYVETPGRFDACLQYTPGEPAWVDHA
jgi:hypothetical protein